MQDTNLNKKWLSDQILSIRDNNYMFAHFYNLLFLICINRFIWKGLPSHIDVDFVEREVANNGELAFINHKTYGFQITFCAGQDFNLYGRPTRYLCWSANNVINEYYEADEIVIIRNNKLSEPSHDFINRYASIIAEVEKTKEINLNAQKTPIAVLCDESERFMFKEIYRQYQGNEPVIFGSKLLDLKSVTVLKTDAPYLVDKLQVEKIENVNECLTFLGINTVAKKKERMITDEVNANNDMVNICLSLFLNPRKKAIEEINEKFGLNVSLELAEYCKNEFEPNVSRETIKEDKKDE